jgi:hypothetical protein
MLVRLTSRNRITLPKNVFDTIRPTEYFEVQTRNGQIILTPVRIQHADAVRAKLAELKLTEKDMADAVASVQKSTR